MGNEVSEIGQSEDLRLWKNAHVLAVMDHRGCVRMITSGESEIRDKQSAIDAQRNISVF